MGNTEKKQEQRPSCDRHGVPYSEIECPNCHMTGRVGPNSDDGRGGLDCYCFNCSETF